MLKKGLYYLKHKGVLQTALLTATYIRGVLRTLFFRAAAGLCFAGRRRALQKAFAGRKLFVFTPTVEWGDLYQRAQQMASCYGAREDCAVLYLSTQRQFDSFLCAKEQKPGVFLMNASLADRIDELTRESACVTACVYNVTSCGALDAFRRDKLVYEYVDELRFIVSQAEDFAPHEARHRELLRRADLTVATASRLYEQVAGEAANALLLPNAVDFDFFSRPAPVCAALRGAGDGYACTLLYYGAIADWFDYETVRASAKAHPEWLWVIIGKVLGGSLKQSGLEELPNVRILPPVPYEELPGCIAAADILTIPFVINETTLATSPVKLFEYLAAGKPVLTADLPECRPYKSVAIYRSAKDLDELVPALCEKKDDADFLAAERREALENTWSRRCEMELQALGLWEEAL